MNASWNGQICKDKNQYSIQFETDDYECYKMVEKACQKAMDEAEKERMKARARKMSTLGHL